MGTFGPDLRRIPVRRGFRISDFGCRISGELCSAVSVSPEIRNPLGESMVVADILMWFLLVIGIYIVFNSYWLAFQGMFPDFVDRPARAASPLRSAPA